MQTNLRSLFAGKREVVEVAPKRGPGRPPKAAKQDEAPEEPDVVLQALESMPDQHEAFDEHLRMRHRKRKADTMLGQDAGPLGEALVEATGSSLGELRIPGSELRSSKHEGPQVKLRLCKWFRKKHEGLGGSDGAHEMLLKAVAERWAVPRAEILRILKNEGTWKEQCDARGVTADGMQKDEAHLPRYLRKSKRSKGTAVRAQGGGKKDKLRFLYPVVKDFFETMRVHGKYIDAVDLEEYLMHTMQRYLDEAAKPDVAAVIEAGPMQLRVEHVKKELEKLRDPKATGKVHEHRQGQLMNFCGARLRTPQRLTVLSVNEERGRWITTLQAYDRLLWEAMRPEFLEEKVLDPKAFVDGIEDAVVIHADQVPCWLRIGSQKQLYGNAEVKKAKKRHQLQVEHLSQPGVQAMRETAPDGMAQTRQTAKGEGDRFRVTLELSQEVYNVFKPSEKPEVRHGRPVLVVPGAHGRLDNIDSKGLFIEDDIIMVKGKQKVRKAKTSAGILMKSWRNLRDHGDEEMKSFFDEVYVCQQPSAFCDGVIIAWITEMRKKAGHSKVISVRDLFAGGLSNSCKRMSVACDALLGFIGGKMTPVMQITDVAVAFNLKKIIEATKAEVRRAKRGKIDVDASFLEADATETKCDAEDLMKIVGRSCKRLREEDEKEDPDRLLKAMRAAGWLSYRADPATKSLVRCDEEDWMQGNEATFEEKSHRHPSAWWEMRYTWRDEAGEPKKPDYKACGRNVNGL